MKQIWWGNEANWWGNEANWWGNDAKCVGEMPYGQSHNDNHYCWLWSFQSWEMRIITLMTTHTLWHLPLQLSHNDDDVWVMDISISIAGLHPSSCFLLHQMEKFYEELEKCSSHLEKSFPTSKSVASQRALLPSLPLVVWMRQTRVMLGFINSAKGQICSLRMNLNLFSTLGTFFYNF